ncbi:MAG: UDP-N-acetylglucosamine--N-acetylmuramyl-(pentapeptide) pyrophosphoryl-undecaprenol N-acetylglucosamine transferase [Planctomycetota bacterium]|nr:UDP-N-acetylglucosamine--N-acetylmuramyl-(pentapeptide) pyrophosphoryl-undecaprenol N-acetylglucosamine transferase [Planctomycetota bacterium]
MALDHLILFAGGGTGGHLFPALAIDEALRSLRNSNTDLATRQTASRFLCSERPIDAKILSEAGVEFSPIPAAPFGIKPRALYRFISNWGLSVRTAREHIRRAKRDAQRVHVVAMGGFVAAPCAQAARVEGVPLTLINLDAVPGKANLWIARRARRIVSTAPTAQGWREIGPLLRAAALAPDSPAACRALLGLKPDAPTLLVTGGSLGARSLNQFMLALTRASASPEGEFARSLHGWQVIHQTGRDADLVELRQAYAAAGVASHVAEFLNPIGVAWGAADFAVCRAGAGSVAEVAANRVPALFLPYPFHKDQHQVRNAERLVSAGAASLSTDHIDPAANLRHAGTLLLKALLSPDQRARMRAAFSPTASANAAHELAVSLLV